MGAPLLPEPWGTIIKYLLIVHGVALVRFSSYHPNCSPHHYHSPLNRHHFSLLFAPKMIRNTLQAIWILMTAKSILSNQSFKLVPPPFEVFDQQQQQ